VYSDQGYCVGDAPKIAKGRNGHLAAIENNNMRSKNRDRDRWYSSLRAPYERVFSQREKRVWYRGIAKNQFALFMQSHIIKQTCYMN
jgi:transposase, IS5 family